MHFVWLYHFMHHIILGFVELFESFMLMSVSASVVCDFLAVNKQKRSVCKYICVV